MKDVLTPEQMQEAMTSAQESVGSICHPTEHLLAQALLQSRRELDEAVKTLWRVDECHKDSISELTKELDDLKSDIEGYVKRCSEQDGELDGYRKALAMMWFAYENGDHEAPHDFEIEARQTATALLGSWTEATKLLDSALSAMVKKEGNNA